MQSQKTELPHYDLVKMTGAAHSQTFNIKCTTVVMNASSIGTGVSRKRAEQASAEKMLKLIEAKKT
jgi:ribonuclease-3